MLTYLLWFLTAMAGIAIGIALGRYWARHVANQLHRDLLLRVEQAEQERLWALNVADELRTKLSINQRSETVEKDRLLGQIEELENKIKKYKMIAADFRARLERRDLLRQYDLRALRSRFGIDGEDALIDQGKLEVYLDHHKAYPDWFKEDRGLKDFFAVLSSEQERFGYNTEPHILRQAFEERIRPLRPILESPERYTRQELKKAEESKRLLDLALWSLYGADLYTRDMVLKVSRVASTEDDNTQRRQRYIAAYRRFFGQINLDESAEQDYYQRVRQA